MKHFTILFIQTIGYIELFDNLHVIIFRIIVEFHICINA